ncbi:hypothetical protein LJC54_06620 [Parabacteroides sp. OttesenSCG-928-J18]|nr:hypothetical protein [Parabacteroides sp. OttesenSCG-928-J18]
MHFRSRLSQRIGMNDIYEMVHLTHNSDQGKEELYKLLFDADDMVAYQAAWVFCHFSPQDNEWLFARQDELIDEVLICVHPGKRRLFLHLLFKQPLAHPPRIDFLDFCLGRMISKDELPGVQSLCMKLAYELCRQIPELLGELRSMLEIMEPDILLPSMRTVRKNILKAMKSGKGLSK